MLKRRTSPVPFSGPHRLAVARRCVAAFAVLVTLMIFLGCMSLNIGCPIVDTAGDEVLVQKGTLHPSGEAEQDVFYPIPYASPPNLTFDEPFCHNLVVVEQQPDHFRVRYLKDKPLVSVFGVEWTAKGTRSPATKAVGGGASAGQ